MPNLDDDLARYADEAWNKRDIKAGLKLLAEVGGLVSLGAFGITAMTVWVPGLNAIGIPISAAAVTYYLRIAAQRYAQLSTEERAVVRKTVRFLHGIFT